MSRSWRLNVVVGGSGKRDAVVDPFAGTGGPAAGRRSPAWLFRTRKPPTATGSTAVSSCTAYFDSDGCAVADLPDVDQNMSKVRAGPP